MGVQLGSSGSPSWGNNNNMITSTNNNSSAYGSPYSAQSNGANASADDAVDATDEDEVAGGAFSFRLDLPPPPVRPSKSSPPGAAASPPAAGTPSSSGSRTPAIVGSRARQAQHAAAAVARRG